MTDTSPQEFNTPLGVGTIIGESFSILFKHFIAVIIMGFVPTVLGILVSGLLTGWGTALYGATPQFGNSGTLVAFVLSLVINIAIYGLTTALLVQLAYDAKLQRRLHLRRYIGPALRAALPIAVLGIVAGILTGLGALALIIPGLWIYAVFCIMPPAVVIDRAGFGGLGRSAALTKGYRWPVAGTIVVMGICTALINYVADILVSIVAPVGVGAGIPIYVVIYSALAAIGYGLSGISIALIYARLREIKEGISVDQIVSVFD